MLLAQARRLRQLGNQHGEQECYRYDECGYLTYQAQAENGFVRDPFSHGYHEQRMVEHADIYQTGHKLNRINDHHYTYDNAGRLSESTLIQHGFRQKTTYYRWNGNNQLESLTNAQGEVWYYKYDALGRRISKDCPQQHLRIEYLWDGDQLAFTQTFKQGKLHSHRHSVFHGWQLIAQQDYYSEFTQNHFGNHTEWKHETSYAITQPNGQVLALFNPQGKRAWRKQPTSLWGLPLLNGWERKQQDPINPNLLFAGQYLDDESGLAYNRFRYYDPESGCYLKSDPIGLAGGETPYGYVCNPLEWVDPFGLAICSARYGRYKDLRKIGYSAKDAARLSRSAPDQLLKNGKIDYTELQDWARVNGLQNSWHPNPQKFPTGGFKYQTGQYSAHGHGANPTAQVQYPGSNAAMGPTVSIKGPQGNLRTDGTWGTFSSDPNGAHIPLINSPF